VTEGQTPPPAAPESPVYPYATQQQWPEGTWSGHSLAGWWGRVGATLLDSIFMFLLIAAAVGAGIGLGAATNELAGIPFYLAGALIWLFYAPVLMAREGDHNGQTWGKQIAGMRVVKEHGRPMAFGASFVREVVIKTILFGWIGGAFAIGWLLDVLWPLWDDQNRALHDMLASTRVVES
jgi:uncharacterized RDD family membrane protein YckC